MIGHLLTLLAAAAPMQALPSSEADSRLALRDFGACVAAAKPAASAKLLQMDFTTEAYRTALRTLADGNSGCMGFHKRARFGPVLFAGALAEALIAREGVDVAKRIAFDPARPALASRGPLETAALCLALQQPAKVASLLATAPASAAEDRAFADVVAALPACLPAGQDARVNRAGLRAIVATASYRIIKTGASASVAVGGQ